MKAAKTVRELNEKEMLALKREYWERKVVEALTGSNFAGVFLNIYENAEDVPDWVIFERYKDCDFSEDDVIFQSK